MARVKFSKVKLPRNELMYTLLHLSLWAQIGVIVRAYLQKFFVLGCQGGWGPCLEGTDIVPSLVRVECIHHISIIELVGGVYFEVLPPNMLGTYIIGLVATSAMVGLDESKSIAMLTGSHPWQSNFPLQVGVRTGLCGSITTFSSWMLEAMTTCIDGNQWVTGIGQIIVGFSCAVLSFALGTQSALLIHHHYCKGPMEDEKIKYVEKEADYIFGRSEEDVRASTELEALEADLPEQMPLSESERRDTDYTIGRNSERSGDVKEEKEEEIVSSGYAPQRVDHCAAILLVLLTIGSCFGVAYETQHTWIRNIWLSVLFAPFGCISRWLLSKLNYKMKNTWEWLPAGTLTANWVGAILDYCLQTIQIRVAPGYWGTLIISAVETGFCGCLTTVSTLIAEIVKLAELIPFSMRSYVYTSFTFIGAFIWGLCFLGWVYWT